MAETGALIGYGTRFQISTDDGDTWEDVAEVYNVTPPSDQIDNVEATHNLSPDRTREYIPGLIEPGEASFEMNFIPGGPGDLLVQELRTLGGRIRCRIIWPNGASWEFSGNLQGYEPDAPVDDRMTATVSFKVTSSYTVSPPST